MTKITYAYHWLGQILSASVEVHNREVTGAIRQLVSEGKTVIDLEDLGDDE